MLIFVRNVLTTQATSDREATARLDATRTQQAQLLDNFHPITSDNIPSAAPPTYQGPNTCGKADQPKRNRVMRRSAWCRPKITQKHQRSNKLTKLLRSPNPLDGARTALWLRAPKTGAISAPCPEQPQTAPEGGGRATKTLWTSFSGTTEQVNKSYCK